MKQLKMLVLCIVLVGSAFLSILPLAAQANSSFKDVPSTHPSYKEIMWGKSVGMIDGFTDGNFQPYSFVTEAQFAKMLSNFFSLERSKAEGGLSPIVWNSPGNQPASVHWSEEHYVKLGGYGVPLAGYYQKEFRSLPIKRGTVAQAFAYILGDEQTVDGSIRYLLERGVTKGQYVEYIESDLQKFFGATDRLTRAQAVMFFYRLHDMQLTSVHPNVQKVFHNEEKLRLFEIVGKGLSLVPEKFHPIEMDKFQIKLPVSDVVNYRNFDQEGIDYFNKFIPAHIQKELVKRGYTVDVSNSEVFEGNKSYTFRMTRSLKPTKDEFKDFTSFYISVKPRTKEFGLGYHQDEAQLAADMFYQLTGVRKSASFMKQTKLYTTLNGKTLVSLALNSSTEYLYSYRNPYTYK